MMRNCISVVNTSNTPPTYNHTWETLKDHIVRAAEVCQLIGAGTLIWLTFSSVQVEVTK